MPYRMIRSERAALARLAQEYKYFDRTTSKNGFIEVFNIDHCEVCGSADGIPGVYCNGCLDSKE